MTLIDHPAQKSAALAARAATAPHFARTGPAVPAQREKAAEREREDEISIPPSGELDEHDERFFAAGEAASQAEPVHHHAKVFSGRASSEEIDARTLAPMVPLERRKRLANLVKGAVAVSSLLLVAGLVRVGLSHASVSTRPGTASVAAAPLAVSELAAAPGRSRRRAGRGASRDAPIPPPAAEAPAAADPLPPAKSAHEEREDARKALERGKLKDAIAAGERSVAIDPTDGEAWLLLGAAHQEAGHGKDAREAYLQCTKQGKTGPLRECAARCSVERLFWCRGVRAGA